MTDSPWYENSFGDLYSLIYKHRSPKAAKKEILQLLKFLSPAPGAKVLDACCGAGRHLKILLEAGLEAQGFDLSAKLLAEAIKNGIAKDKLIQADIRDIPFKNKFEFTFNLFNSFGYFENEAENLSALCSLAGTLMPGGQLVMDHFNRARLEKDLKTETLDSYDNFSVQSFREIKNNRIQKKMLVTHKNGEKKEYFENVQLYTEKDLRQLFEEAKLTEIKSYGDFDGSELNDISPRMLFIGKKKCP